MPVIKPRLTPKQKAAIQEDSQMRSQRIDLAYERANLNPLVVAFAGEQERARVFYVRATDYLESECHYSGERMNREPSEEIGRGRMLDSLELNVGNYATSVVTAGVAYKTWGEALSQARWHAAMMILDGWRASATMIANPFETEAQAAVFAQDYRREREGTSDDPRAVWVQRAGDAWHVVRTLDGDLK